ncbi:MULTISPECIES: hypothetical protein [Sphingobacterium]|uniref:Uncharacterized protein n=1 Tax=Sphingobacterium hotanense TaxID=649196 RepID=A0ABT7NT40_9SPHI|nr:MULTISPECIES: hypothetical protein [Sphingobacterium]MDM1050346.1 hypothetical protein [Sphingobacterium hotanense]
MFKKITSNRPPDTTVWTAFYREFGKYIDGGAHRTKRFLEARPRTVFFAMVASILVSVGCFLFLPKETPKKEPLQLSVQQPLMDGMGGIVITVSALKELLEIRTVLDTLMQKDNLDSSDSLLMERAIDRMQVLEKRLAEANKQHNSP